MRLLLSRTGSDTERLLVQAENWDTPVYAKFYDGDRELERADIGCFNRLSAERETELLRALGALGALASLLPPLHVLIVISSLRGASIPQSLGGACGKFCRADPRSWSSPLPAPTAMSLTAPCAN